MPTRDPDPARTVVGAGIPVTLDEAVREGRVKQGDLVCLAGFSHVGDYAAAMLIRWNIG